MSEHIKVIREVTETMQQSNQVIAQAGATIADVTSQLKKQAEALESIKKAHVELYHFQQGLLQARVCLSTSYGLFEKGTDIPHRAICPVFQSIVSTVSGQFVSMSNKLAELEELMEEPLISVMIESGRQEVEAEEF